MAFKWDKSKTNGPKEHSHLRVNIGKAVMKQDRGLDGISHSQGFWVSPIRIEPSECCLLTFVLDSDREGSPYTKPDSGGN